MACARRREGERRRDQRHWTAKIDRCPKGHPYSGDNLELYRQRGRRKASRYCKQCHRERQRLRRGCPLPAGLSTGDAAALSREFNRVLGARRVTA